MNKYMSQRRFGVLTIILGIVVIALAILITPTLATKYLLQDHNITSGGIKQLNSYRIDLSYGGLIMIIIGFILIPVQNISRKLQPLKRFIPLGELLLLAVFAISFQQFPLYSSNQNTYFLHGLANGGIGFLKLDWFAHTADPFPVFSALVKFTVQFLGENAFYFQYMVILAIFVYSILGISCCVLGIDESRTKYLSLFALFSLWYSGLFVSLLSKLPGLFRFSSILDANGLLSGGVADQYILGPYFQPSTFGVFLILSIYSFLRGKPFIAVTCLAIAATFHSTYLLSAAVLTCIFMAIIVIKEKDYRKVFLLGTTAIVLVTPILIHAYLNFSATTAAITVQAQNILVDYRIPHHALISNWFRTSTIIQIIVVALSIFIVRNTKLFPILLGSFLAAIILSIVQVLTGSKFLALLFPWRISVFLVPIASSIILASIVSLIFQIFRKSISKSTKLLQIVILGIFIILGYVGIHRTITLLNAPRIGVNASTRFVSSTFQPGNLFLVPLDIESFRLAAKVPILIDYKSNPYKDTDVVEWFNRNTNANDFYTSSSETTCTILENISNKYSITHVVMRNDTSISKIANCAKIVEIYNDADFVIYELHYR